MTTRHTALLKAPSVPHQSGCEVGLSRDAHVQQRPEAQLPALLTETGTGLCAQQCQPYNTHSPCMKHMIWSLLGRSWPCVSMQSISRSLKRQHQGGVQGLAVTGSGKTAAFVLPMVVHIMDQPELEKGEGPIGLICAPTRELGEQIHKVLHDVSTWQHSDTCNSGPVAVCVAGGAASAACGTGWELQACHVCCPYPLGEPQCAMARPSAYLCCT